MHDPWAQVSAALQRAMRGPRGGTGTAVPPVAPVARPGGEAHGGPYIGARAVGVARRHCCRAAGAHAHAGAAAQLGVAHARAQIDPHVRVRPQLAEPIGPEERARGGRRRVARVRVAHQAETCFNFF